MADVVCNKVSGQNNILSLLPNRGGKKKETTKIKLKLCLVMNALSESLNLTPLQSEKEERLRKKAKENRD